MGGSNKPACLLGARLSCYRPRPAISIYYIICININIDTDYIVNVSGIQYHSRGARLPCLGQDIDAVYVLRKTFV